MAKWDCFNKAGYELLTTSHVFGKFNLSIMKKVFCLLLLSSCLFANKNATAQSGSVFSDRLELGLAANYNTDVNRFGLSGHAKWLFPSPTNGQFLITGKLTHTAPSNGNFFSTLDRGKYDNIAAAHLMGGYRYYFRSGPRNPVAAGSAFFVEGNAGLSFVSRGRTFGAGLNPAVGYSTLSGLAFSLGYQGVLAFHRDKQGLQLLEAGVAYRF